MDICEEVATETLGFFGPKGGREGGGAGGELILGRRTLPSAILPNDFALAPPLRGGWRMVTWPPPRLRFAWLQVRRPGV